MRRTKNLSLVLVPILLAACGDEIPADQQRDVYTKFEDCMADWGKEELCMQLGEADAKQFAEATTGVAGGGGGSHVIYWGPTYYPGDRAVIYNGQSIAPTTNRAMSRPFAVRSTSSAAARNSPATARSTSVSRGGFGGGGKAAGGSSGG
jgi:uncharacterized protein YgiB involved in biofilm formation